MKKYRKFTLEEIWKIIEGVIKNEKSVDSASKESGVKKSILRACSHRKEMI